MSGILLILGGMHACIVRHTDDHACVDACVRAGIQRVSGHIQSDMLHAAEASLARKAGAESDFHRHLLIGCPLTIDLFKFRSLFRHFGAGGSGVAGNHAASRLIQPPRKGLIAKH